MLIPPATCGIIVSAKPLDCDTFFDLCHYSLIAHNLPMVAGKVPVLTCAGRNTETCPSNGFATFAHLGAGILILKSQPSTTVRKL